MKCVEVHIWPIDRLVFYRNNPRKNNAVVDKMVASIQAFGRKIGVTVTDNIHKWTRWNKNYAHRNPQTF